MARGIDASSFNMTSFSPPYFLFSEATDMSSWRPNKIPFTTQTKKACSFNIEAILSLGPREAAAQKIQQIQQPGGSAQHHPAMLTWAHRGHLKSSLYPFYYQQPNGYNRVLFNGQRDSLFRGTFLRRCRRIRTIYTDEQLTKLEEVFCKQRYMTGTEKMLLAKSLGLSETQVKVWFQNRRTRWRKSQEEVSCSPDGESLAHRERPNKKRG
uniref:Homeobox domain-containing protein n=2 Tax=Esox lucius TaxID=8010 RepID=A0A3P9ALG3_ESOLU